MSSARLPSTLQEISGCSITKRLFKHLFFAFNTFFADTETFNFIIIFWGGGFLIYFQILI